LLGYIVKGHKACLVCEEEIFSIQLKNERKIVYFGARRFLPMFHRYRRLQNGSTKKEKAPEQLNSEHVYQ